MVDAAGLFVCPNTSHLIIHISYHNFFLSVESFEVKKALQYEDRDDGAFWMPGIPKTPTRAQLDGFFCNLRTFRIGKVVKNGRE